MWMAGDYILESASKNRDEKGLSTGVQPFSMTTFHQPLSDGFAWVWYEYSLFQMDFDNKESDY